MLLLNEFQTQFIENFNSFFAIYVFRTFFLFFVFIESFDLNFIDFCINLVPIIIGFFRFFQFVFHLSQLPFSFILQILHDIYQIITQKFNTYLNPTAPISSSNNAAKYSSTSIPSTNSYSWSYWSPYPSPDSWLYYWRRRANLWFPCCVSELIGLWSPGN